MSSWSRIKAGLIGARLRHIAPWLLALGLCLTGWSLLSAPRNDALAERAIRAGRVASTELAAPLRSGSSDLNARTRALLVRRDIGFAWLRVRDASGQAIAATGRLEPTGQRTTSAFGRDLRRNVYSLISTEHRAVLMFGQQPVGSLEFGLLIGAASVGATSGQLVFGLLALLFGVPALLFQSRQLFQLVRSGRLFLDEVINDRTISRNATTATRVTRSLADVSAEALPPASVMASAAGELLSIFDRGGIVLDHQQTIREMNTLAEQLTGWPIEKARHRPVTEILQLFHADLRRVVVLPLAECLSGKLDRFDDSLFLRDRNSSVREIALSLGPARDSAGGIIGVLITLSEIETKSGLLQQAASAVAAPRQNAQGLSQVLTDQLLENVITTDSQDRIQFANERALASFGYALAEICGKHVGCLLPVPFLHLSRVRVADYALVLPDMPATPAVARRRDGSQFDASLTVQPVSSSERASFLITVRPVVMTRQAQPELKPEIHSEPRAQVARRVAGAIKPESPDQVRQAAAVPAEISQRDAKLDFLAYHDALTGLPSRSLFVNRLEHVVTSADAGKSGFAVVHLALPEFASINQHYGYDSGDRLIKTVADRLSASVGAADTVARLGGAEFLLLLQGLSHREEVMTVLKQHRLAIAQTFRVGLQHIEMSASFGATVYPEDKVSPDLLLRHAGLALREAQARSQGRDKGRIQIYRENLAAAAQPNDDIATQLREAQARGQLEIELQALTDVRTRQIVGAEVLLAWRQGRAVLRTTEELKQAGISEAFIAALVAWVIERACEHYGNWRDLELPALPLLINATTLQFTDRGMLQKLRGMLAQYRVPAKQLIIMLNSSELESWLLRPDSGFPLARDLGLRIGISDVDLTRLDLLRHADVDVMQLTPRTTAGLPVSDEAVQRTTAIIRAGQRVGAQIFVSGIERAEQREVLLGLGCYLQQGRLLSEVMSPREFSRLLARAEIGAI